MTAEQVKAIIVAKVTGQVVPSIQAEAGDPGPSPMETALAGVGIHAHDTSTEQLVAVHHIRLNKLERAQSAPSPAPELQEGLDAFRLGFANVLVYRAFKALEARVAELEAR